MKIKIIGVLILMISSAVVYIYRENVSLTSDKVELESTLNNAVESIDTLLTEKSIVEEVNINNTSEREKALLRVQQLQNELRGIRSEENDQCGRVAVPNRIADRL